MCLNLMLAVIEVRSNSPGLDNELDFAVRFILNEAMTCIPLNDTSSNSESVYWAELILLLVVLKDVILLDPEALAIDQILELVDAVCENNGKGKEAENHTAHAPIAIAFVGQLKFERGPVNVKNEGTLLTSFLSRLLHFNYSIIKY